MSETGLNILNKSGIAISKSTQRRVLYKTAANHGKIVSEFIDINEASRNKDLLVLMIDYYTNIHTKQRPSTEETSTARSMATILLKRFSGLLAIPAERSAMNPVGVSSELLVELFTAKLLKLSSTFAASMPSGFVELSLIQKWREKCWKCMITNNIRAVPEQCAK